MKNVKKYIAKKVLSIKELLSNKSQKIAFASMFLVFGLMITLNSYAHEGGTDILINAGGPSFTDSQGRNWSSDSFYNTGSSLIGSDAIAGTEDDLLYQSERWDSSSEPELMYSIPIDNGEYEVVLHYADIYAKTQGVGKRVFDVSIEGSLVENDFDIYKEIGGYTALAKTYTVVVSDNTLNIDFGHVIQNPKISGIEVHSVEVPEPPPVTPPVLNATRINAGGSEYTDINGNIWSADNSYNTGMSFAGSNTIASTEDDALYQSERWDPPLTPELIYNIEVVDGNYDVVLHYAEIYAKNQSVGKRVFDVFIEGAQVEDNFDIYAVAGANTAYSKSYPVSVTDGEMSISFGHVVNNPKISAIEILPKQAESHFAHAVPGDDKQIVDIDGNGSENVAFDGSFSHTHAFGEDIIKWEWQEGQNLLASGEQVNINLAIGIHTITLFVEDSAGNSAVDDVVVEVLVDANVPGLISYFYKHDNSLSNIPAMPNSDIDWAQISGNINFTSTTGSFAGTPYADQFSAKFIGYINIPTTGTYGFAIESDDGSRLLIDGVSLIENDGVHGMTKKSASKVLTAGKHPVEVQFFDNTSGAGLKFYWTQPSQSEAIVPEAALTHSFSARLPIINTLSPSFGPLTGGNKVTVNGLGFVYPANQIQINIGGTTLTNTNITVVNENTLEFIAPPHAQGTVNININTPAGTGNTLSYLYSDTALPPVAFTQGTLLSGIVGPTSIAFGPDGKLYVGTQYGDIVRITLDEDNNVVNTFTSSVIQTSEPTFRSILGIAFNPLDDPNNPKVYVAHSQLFHGQSSLANSYRGKVSTLSGSNLDVKADVITNLPVSDHDHGVNGIDFDTNGNMYVQIGGNTNAGVPGSLSTSGILPEAYFTAATIVAYINDPNFNGNLTYNSSGIPNGGYGIEVYASGQRNPYDLLWHSNGKLYATDNGPNTGYGGKSVTCSTSGSDPSEGDEFNLIIKNGYYGHANRIRGTTDARQCKWRSINEASDADYTKPLTTFPASTNGLAEYWTNNFAGQMKGKVLVSRWQGELFELKLSSDGQTVDNKTTFSTAGGLDVAVGPNGTIFIAQNGSDKIIYHKPTESAPSELHVNSVFPYKGPTNGGRVVTIRGNNFGNTTNTTVSIGGNTCSVNSVTSTQITCTTPASLVNGAVDVQVNVDGASKTLAAGYIYVSQGATPTPTPSPTSTPTPTPTPTSNGSWSTLLNVPTSLGEVSAASVNGELYLFHGEDINHTPNNKLYKYNQSTNTWTQLANQNVAPATDHAAAGVINGKIYVFGGLGSSGESSSLAIYDPASNTWTAGAPLQKSGSNYGIGSPSGGVVNGKLYIAGGIHANTTINYTFVYDPVGNTWTELAPMPSPRNHAAGVGYNGKFYVFGGRCCGGNSTGLGNNNTYIYDPTSNTWSTGANMPTARGGMGSGVELNGELLVIGGEGSGPFNGTFDKVEAYNPTTNSWRTLASITTPRHGIFPVNVNNKIHVVAGGTSEGFSVSSIHEAYTPSSSPTPSPTVTPTPTTTLTPTPSPTGTPSPTPTPIPSGIFRINSGGNSFTDSIGNLWSADTGYNTGSSYSTSTTIAGTADQSLYKTERWDSSTSPSLNYIFAVPNGSYTVILHFADIYSGTQAIGKRIFDVSIEGSLILDNYDIFADVGGYKAVKKEFNVVVSDSNLNISFDHVVNNPKISGIEIIPL